MLHQSGDGKLPLAVDLDGTLIPTDSLHEGCVACVASQPATIVQLWRSLFRGKASFKQEVAQRVSLDPALLPYNRPLLKYLTAQKKAGRRLGLFTAADQSIADRVAAHLQLFDVVRGSDGATNLAGRNKIRAIREAFGDRFVYAGNDTVDAPIFEEAHRVVLVGPVDKLRKLLKNEHVIEASFPSPGSTPRAWVKALRPHHWAKNVLVFVAPILALPVLSPSLAVNAVLLFLAFSLLASATYILNDLIDLEADRSHPRKRFRPFARGALGVGDGISVAVALALTAFLLSLPLPHLLPWLLAVYLALTLAYSLVLKRQPIVDVVVLASLFTLRVLAGSLLLPIPPSPWLLTFAMLFFLGLAMVKRYTELDQVSRSGGHELSSRGYTVKDSPLLLTAGVSAGFGAIVIFMIYLINEHYPRETYSRPDFLWAIMPLILIWILRLWHLTVHGKMNDDPLVFALSDRFSLMLAGLAALVLVVAWT